MKQRITQEQMNELSHQAKLKFADWADPLDELDWERASDGRIFKYRLPLLTIGQMIWFLHDHANEDGIYYAHLTEMYGPYDGGFLSYDVGEWRVSSTYSAKELCDALWLAVKDYLEQKGADYERS